MPPQTPFAIISDDFKAVDRLIQDQLDSRVPLVSKIGDYLINSGGKRVRPMLVLLVCGALNYQKENRLPLAAVIEYLHTATLLHDDVVDESDRRRGKTTANIQWGNAPSILVGDFLYSRAFQLMVRMGDLRVMDVLADATNTIAEGEVHQLTRIGQLSTSEEDYRRIIYAKTAMLFEAATHSAALLASESDEQMHAMKAFGMHLGNAFQLVDDVLDYNGDAKSLGKDVGDDLAEGKMTLPLIHAYAHASEEGKALIKQAVRKPSPDAFQPILALLNETGSLNYSIEAARAETQSALDNLSVLPDSPHKEALAYLCESLIKRIN